MIISYIPNFNMLLGTSQTKKQKKSNRYENKDWILYY